MKIENTIDKIDADRLYTLKALIGDTLFHYIYEVPDVEDIHVNSFNGKALVKYAGSIKKQIDISLNESHWKSIFYYLSTFTGNPYKENSNLLIQLPGNHRFMGTMGLAVESKISITIRVFKHNLKSSFKDFGISKNFEKYLKTAVLNKNNIFISGATGSGKTTFLNLLIKEIPIKERVISVDDTKEMKIPHEDKVELFNKNHAQNLDFILKSRPDRILLGELTTENAHAVEKFLTNGHKGFMMTMHANNPYMAITDTFYAKLSQAEKSVNAPEKLYKLLKSEVDIVIQLKQTLQGQRSLTDILFPKTDKGYTFPRDYELFENECLQPYNVNKNKEKIKEKICAFLNKQKCISVKEIADQYNIDYKTAIKLIPPTKIKKNFIKYKVHELINDKTDTIHKILLSQGVIVSKRHLRRIKQSYKQYNNTI